MAIKNTLIPIIITSAVIVAPAVALAAYDRPFNADFTSSTTSSDRPPVQYSRSATDVQSVAREVTAAERADTLRAVLKRYSGSTIGSVRLGGPPEGWRATEDDSIPVPDYMEGGIWAYFVVKARRPDPPSLVPAVWEAEVVAGVLRDKLHALGDHNLIGCEVSIELPSGRVLPDIAGGIGHVAFGQRFENPPVAGLIENLQSRVVAAGLRAQSIHVLTVDQAAPMVTATTDHPTAVARNPDRILNTIFGSPGTYEAEFLRIDDEAGNPVLMQASTFRTGRGNLWIRPDLDPRHLSR